MATCKVTRSGNLATVALPADWRRDNNVHFGDELEAITDVQGAITFRKPKQANRLAAMQRFFDFVDSLPVIEWADGAEPDDDKRALEERHA